MPVKTKVIDTSAMTPEAFLAGAPAPESKPAATPSPDAAPPFLEQPGTVVQDPAFPERPGLETPPAQQPAPTPDPFVVLERWNTANTHRTLRAMEVPGGCVLKCALAYNSVIGESMCFVPGVKVADGKLVAL